MIICELYNTCRHLRQFQDYHAVGQQYMLKRSNIEAIPPRQESGISSSILSNRLHKIVAQQPSAQKESL